MIRFKHYLLESIAVPYCFADISDSPLLREDFWDGAHPLSVARKIPTDQYATHLLVPSEHWNTENDVDDTRHHLSNHGNHISTIHRTPHEPAGPETVGMYTGMSADLNNTLIMAHVHNLDPTNSDHFHEAFRHYYTEKLGEDDFEFHKKMAKRLLDGMHRITESVPPVEKSFRVYSGIGSGFELGKAIKKGNGLVHFPAYTSTSLRHTKALNFSSPYGPGKDYKKEHMEVMAIDIPKGSRHGIYVEDHSSIESEREFILKRGTNIRFKEEPRLVHIPYTGNVIIHKGTIES